MERICEKCGNSCEPEGEFGKYVWWCDECGDYADGVDTALANYDELYDLMDSIKSGGKP